MVSLHEPPLFQVVKDGQKDIIFLSNVSFALDCVREKDVALL